MKSKKIIHVIMLVFIYVLTNCAEDNTSKKKPTLNPEKNIVEKSICELLSMEEVGKIMEVTFEEATQTLHTVDNNASSYVSQCAYYTNKGLQHIAVVVRHFKSTTFPQTAKEFLSASKVGDAELDKEVDEAMQNYIAVEGIGDAAFAYSLWESNSLVVHWSKHYEMIISMHDFNLDPETIEKIKLIAMVVLQRIN